MQEKLHTVKEIAQKFDVINMTVYSWIKKGELKIQKNPISGRVKISDEAINEFILQRERRRSKKEWFILFR